MMPHRQVMARGLLSLFYIRMSMDLVSGLFFSLVFPRQNKLGRSPSRFHKGPGHSQIATLTTLIGRPCADVAQNTRTTIVTAAQYSPSFDLQISIEILPINAYAASHCATKTQS